MQPSRCVLSIQLPISSTTLTPLQSLLSGPTVNLIHDEAGDGSFKPFAQSVPVRMLTYFSTTLRTDYENQSTQTLPRPCDCRRRLFHQGQSHHAACPGYLIIPPKTPEVLAIVGGDTTSHRDVLQWMKTSCDGGNMVKLSSVVASPTRLILAMTSIEILNVEHLREELPQLINKLQNEMLDIETVGKIFASGDNVLPEVRDGICTCVAGYFYAGRLNNPGRWMYLAKMNRRFDEGVWRVLEMHGDMEGLDVWQTKDARRYPGQRSGNPIAPQQQRMNPSRPHHTELQSIAYPSPSPYGHPASCHMPQPPPLSPTIPSTQSHYHQYSSPPKETRYLDYPPPSPHSQGPYYGHHPQWNDLQRSASHNISPRTLPKQVRFDENPRIHPASASSELAWHSPRTWHEQHLHRSSGEYVHVPTDGYHDPGFSGGPWPAVPLDQWGSRHHSPAQHYRRFEHHPYTHHESRWG